MRGSDAPPADALGELVKIRAADDYEVFPENARAVRVFFRLHSCWVVLSDFNGSRYHGMDYARVKAALELMGEHEALQALFEDLQIMEVAALEELRLIEKARKK